MGRFENHVLQDFNGLNEDENPNALERLDLVRARNIWKRGKATGTRPGTERDDVYSADIAGTPAIQGIFEFRKNADADRQIIVVAGGEIKSNHTTNETGAVTVTAGAANRWTFATHKGSVYSAGGTATDDLWKWDGAAATASVVGPLVESDGATLVYPTFIIEKWNRLFTCQFRDAAGTGFSTDKAASLMTVRYSALNDGDTWPEGNSFGGDSAIGGFSSFGNEFLNGFGSFTDNEGDWLLVLGNRRLYAVDPTGDPFAPFRISRRGAIANGCVSQHAFVSLGLDSGDAIYLSDQGIHSLRQSQEFGARQDKFLSWKIRKTFRTVNQSALSRATGAYWKEEGVVLFAFPTGSNTVNDTILALDVKNKRELTAENADWYIWQRGSATPAVAACNVLVPVRDASENWFVYGGNEAGQVFRFTDSTHTDLDAGVAQTAGYEIAMQTKHDDLGESTIRKGSGDVFWALQPGGSYGPAAQIVYDYGRRQSSISTLKMPKSGATFGPTGNGVFGVSKWSISELTFRDKMYGEGSGDTLGFLMTHAGENQPVYVAQIASQVRTFGELSGEDTGA